MFEVVPKWKIMWTNDTGTCTLYASDRYLGDILRRFADVHFSPSGIENEPTEFKVEKVVN